MTESRNLLSEVPLIANPAKNILKNGGAVFGFNVFESLRPSVVKIAAQTGYNLLLVENEHILHNDETLTNFLGSVYIFLAVISKAAK